MSSVEYTRVFKQLCHMVALSRDGQLKPAIDNLVVTILALERNALLKTGADVAEAIGQWFGLNLSETLVQSSVDRCVTLGKLVRDRASKSLTLPPNVRAEIRERAEHANRLERDVREEWLAAVEHKFRNVSSDWADELWACLQQYMVSAFRQHGVETIQLLDPGVPVDAENNKHLQTYFEESAATHLSTVSRENAFEAVQLFFSESTPNRTRYTIQLLDGTFTLFALTVDEATSAYLRGSMAPLKLFMDTNFIFDILGLHHNPLTDASRELVDVVEQGNFPITLVYHEATLSELQRTLYGLGSGLRGQRWLPSLSRVALKLSHLNDVERLYHETNAESPVSPDIFLSKYENVSELLKQYNFEIYRASQGENDNDSVRHELVADYKDFVESGSTRERTYEALDHDMLVRLTVARQRQTGASALDAGAFFLTTDFTLYRYDSRRMQQQRALGLVVLPNQVLQLLRPFVAPTDDFDRRFIEAFAIPEFRSIESDYSTAQVNVLEYLNTYSNMTEQTASRILANNLLMNQLKDIPEDSEQFEKYIESALAKDNENLLSQNSRLQATIETTQREMDAAQAKLASEERQTQEVKSALAATAKRAEEREAEREEQIERLQRENATRIQENQDLAQRFTKLQSLLRYMTAIAIAVLGLGLIGAATFVRWPWLEQHPHKLGLYVAAVLIVGAIVWAVADKNKKRRGIALAVLLIGVVISLIPIVDGQEERNDRPGSQLSGLQRSHSCRTQLFCIARGVSHAAHPRTYEQVLTKDNDLSG